MYNLHQCLNIIIQILHASFYPSGFFFPIFHCIWQGSPLIYKNVIMCTFQSFALLIHYLMEISPKHDIVPIHSFKLLSNISWRNHNSAAYPFKYDRDLWSGISSSYLLPGTWENYTFPLTLVRLYDKFWTINFR